MTEWNPIKTAPRDGTEILIFAPVCTPTIMVMQWIIFEGDPEDEGGWYDTGAIDSCQPIFDGDATHWLPLPEPPGS